MKVFFKVFLALFILQGCNDKNDPLNQFSPVQDTLVIRTQKVKGTRPFLFGAGNLAFNNVANELKYPVGIANIELGQIPADFKSEKPQYVNIIKGLKQGEKVFIVDQNNNNNFTDDTAHTFQKMNWYSSINSIKCKYLISNGTQMVNDSSWVRIGMSNDRILCGRDEHLTAKFNLNKNYYEISIIDQMSAMTFTYDSSSEIALTSNNGVVKDSLVIKDLLKMGEFINLDGKYYRFDKITNNGDYITLVKENNFDSKIGTQIGMFAPDFAGITIANDTITSSDFYDKVLVIANSCGCGGDTLSTKAYYDIKNTYNDKIHVLRLDSKIEDGLDGIHIDMDNEYNKDIYHKYRNAYCSRIAYVVKNGRLIEKFQITDWESVLPKIIDFE